MKFLFSLSFLSLIITSCQTKPVGENKTPETSFAQPTDTLIVIPYEIVLERRAYKFDDRNNNKKYLAEKDGYDAKNNLVEHLRFNITGDTEEYIVSIYENDHVKIEYRLENPNNQTLYKTLFWYQSDGKLISKTTYDFQKRMRKDVDKGFGRPGGCVIMPSDFEDKKSWGEKSVDSLYYNHEGQLIETIAIANGYLNKTLYTNDSKGRVTEEICSQDENDNKKTSKTYYPDSMQSVCSLYNYSGNPYHLTRKIEYYSTTNLRYDKNKNEIDEQCIIGNRQFLRRLKTYDTQNRITQEEYVTNLGTSIFTKYEYVTLSHPAKKLFIVDNK